ncbi:hypothetical protein GGI20_002195 [Coemansia sp. BCRC 34301]|nr:hypothetical protein GGI20_002195 [Coemansia sp. BCRC 34301]
MQQLIVVNATFEASVNRVLSLSAAPFPKLIMLIIPFEYPFFNDVLFQGNSDSLDYLEICIDKKAVDILNRCQTFSGKYKALRTVSISEGYRTGGISECRQAMSNVLGPKQLLSDGTKFRILCVMFRYFSLEYNNISTLANPASEPFQQLVGNVMAYQPGLRSKGEALTSTLESFVSNQNSRIFCALSDLHEWHRSGMAYNILQLTLKHVHSIFKRPPYEPRRYTQELTYAQRLIMIYHMCNPESWSLIVEAYAALYERQYKREWENRDKFSCTPSLPLPIPPDIYQTIHECTLASYALQPLAPLPPVESASNIPASYIGNPAAALGIKGGRVIKRRALSAATKTKSAQVAIREAIAKPRSVSFASSTSNVHPLPATMATNCVVLPADPATNFWTGTANFCPTSVNVANIPGLYQFDSSSSNQLPHAPFSGFASEEAAALAALEQQFLQQHYLQSLHQQQADLAGFNRDDFLSAFGIGPLTSAVSHVTLANSPVFLAQTSENSMLTASSCDSQVAATKASAVNGLNTSTESLFFYGSQR